ncbi:anaerobic glycerol-3-phosphate dehydrogenase subunit C [Roseiconus nitratireducens]|uniref:Anaerobic glycerol-3-phosphate dehydrogenase subunit C n=1 Tax=Roseiconus nitratireducens TaxID=2605748 RepID=A0A5M6DFC9_9BACT|nr:anaerobic glycerol-3-phosphate dehydrogenase subunit C [Roseiconus nitratireducens]KAA5546198.1 anaerobic glycerol-3-phosphate dehydrogenase subunit C [Roseiconus nitratireducens]
MEIDRQRIQDDLRGIVRGDVMCDPISTTLYASDASVYEIQPIGVVRPRSDADVIAVVQYAAEHDLPLHPRGSGSGVAGESLGPGLMLDFSRYMRRMQIHGSDGLVTVQAGLTLAEMNRNLRPLGRWFGPDPATRSITTMGGVLAVNASGSHYLRSGAARDNVSSMRIITVDGEWLDVSKHHPDEPGTAGRLARGLLEIRSKFESSLQALEQAPPARGGYRLDGIVDNEGRVDLAKFLTGTQGTLAVVANATVRTEAIPGHRGVILLFYHRLESAARSAVHSLEYGPVACDLMGRRLLDIARETERQFDALLPRASEAMLLLELQGDSLEELENRIQIVRRELSRGDDAAFSSVATTDQQTRDQYWSLCRRVTPRLSRLKGSGMPIPFTEDIAVPAERLPEALAAIQGNLRDNECTATIFAHAGHGQLHLRPFLDLSRAEDRQKMNRVAYEIAEVVWTFGGQVGVEHAAGLSRSALLPTQFREYWSAMGQIKRLFDPQHRLNPGKLFGAVLQQPNDNLRPVGETVEISSETRTLVPASERVVQMARLSRASVPELPVLQHWPPNEMIDDVVQSCNGCARCRTTADSERQCPVFRTMRTEEATPRAKANLLRGVLSGKVSVESLAGDRAKAVADLCFNCHQCRLECPASVDIPKIVGELKAQYVATNGQPVSDRLLGRLDTVAAIGSRMPWLFNPLLRNPLARWFAEKLFGISSARELPPIASGSFMRYAARRRWTKPPAGDGAKVLYFVDHYANYHDPDLGRALAEVLQQNGIAIYVPTAQSGSGMARITAGDLKGARRIARRNVRMLSDAVRSGYKIVATEPAAVLCLKHEYPNLLDDEDAHLVAKNSYEACEYFYSLQRDGNLDLDLHPVEVEFAYHQPCHLRVLDPDVSSVRLLQLIPGLTMRHIEGGCSGMAGTWGLQRKNYRNSLRIGWPMISAMRGSNLPLSCTECSSCKMQIEHGTESRTLHPIKILAYAYGRLPKIADQLASTVDA